MYLSKMNIGLLLVTRYSLDGLKIGIMKQIFQTDEETSLFINFLNKIKGRIMKNDINEGG